MSVEQEHSRRAAAGAVPTSPLGLRHLVPLAVALVACVVAYAGTVGALYVQNAMWHVPLSDLSSGAYDTNDLPRPRDVSTTLLGYVAVLATPFVAGVGVFFVGVDVAHSVRAGRSRRQVAPAAAVFALSAVAVLAFITAGRITTWHLD